MKKKVKFYPVEVEIDVNPILGKLACAIQRDIRIVNAALEAMNMHDGFRMLFLRHKPEDWHCCVKANGQIYSPLLKKLGGDHSFSVISRMDDCVDIRISTSDVDFHSVYHLGYEITRLIQKKHPEQNIKFCDMVHEMYDLFRQKNDFFGEGDMRASKFLKAHAIINYINHHYLADRKNIQIFESDIDGGSTDFTINFLSPETFKHVQIHFVGGCHISALYKDVKTIIHTKDELSAFIKKIMKGRDDVE